jgi:hypothetical protein
MPKENKPPADLVCSYAIIVKGPPVGENQSKVDSEIELASSKIKMPPKPVLKANPSIHVPS